VPVDDTSDTSETPGPGRRATILPAGAVTFLAFRAEVAVPDPGDERGVPDDALARCHELVGAAVAEHGGVAVEEASGGRATAAFPAAADSVAAALAVHRQLRAGPWPSGRAPVVRIGLHTGEARRIDAGYQAGATLDRAVRLRDIAHGGQTLLSSVTASLVDHALPDGAVLAELGLHRLNDLSRPVLVHELRHPDLAGALPPPLRSLDAAATNLPIQLTSFVGRSGELARVERLLGGERLMTLTGPGGCGKTRLALQAAADEADRWPDGVWWADLAPITDPTLVARVVASTIGVLVEPMGGPLRAMGLQLRDRRMLVCLDNCEHLLDACAEVAEALARSCPDVTVLATSREPLGVAGESVWPVPPLSEDEAITLFVERATRVRPWFTLDATNEGAVRTMCRRLDGLPLAIELAAAWLRTLTPAQIAAGLDDRFALLVRGPRGAAARHQTLVSSIEWSHDRLDPVDRVVFRRLGVFGGGFTLEAARAVCGAAAVGDTDTAAGVAASDADVLGALGRLVDKSLVVMDERDGEARYRLLETLREYAADRLEAAGETAAVRDRHLDHFLSVGERSAPGVLGEDPDVRPEAWLARLETEHDNLRAALRWGLSSDDPSRGRRLAAAVFWLWYLHGHTDEGTELLQQAIASAPDDRSPVQVTLLAGVAAVSVASGRFDVMLDAALRGLDLASAIGDDLGRGQCLLLLGVAQSYVDIPSAREVLVQGVAASRAAGDDYIADRSLAAQGVLLSFESRHDEARPILEEGLARFVARGDRAFAVIVLGCLVVGDVMAGDLATAEARARLGVEIAEPAGDYYTVGLAISHLAFVRAYAGDVGEADRLMRPIARSVEGATRTLYVVRMNQALGRLAQLAGDDEAAAAWYRRDIADTGLMADSVISARSCPWLADALRRLGRVDEARAAAERAVSLAEKLGTPHLVADGLEQLGHLAAPDRPDDAEDLHHRALAERVDHGIRLFQVDSLDALAGLSAVDRPEEATRVLAASEAARETMGYPRPSIDVPQHEATLNRLRAALGDDGFGDAWAAGARLSLDEAVAYVRRSRGTRGRPSTGWASLTPTELEVVAGVVDGLSNPEIGTRLFMSRGTVKTHLSHIYAKLGVANRTELAAAAANRGLDRADDR
jgi:predicted ATPase/DNA-binding CsgD family transcriptional regulator